jgi:FkbM family methyltransferase
LGIIRSNITGFGYSALATGFRLPKTKIASDFLQWSNLIDLIRRLDINVFLDVGANRGFFSKHLRAAGYRNLLISFEPVPEDSEHIRRFAKNDNKWIVCDYALGAKTETRQFHINDCNSESVLSSFLPMKEAVGRSRNVSVAIRRIDEVLPDLLDGFGSPRIFLKMDTQGFDSQVINGAGDFLPRVFGIQSELSVVPLYEGMEHYTEALSYYERLGFSLMDLFVVSRAQKGQIVEYDCVMARTSALDGDTLKL